MKAGNRIKYEDDIVVVMDGKKEIYRGMEDYEPMKREYWVWKTTTKNGKGHYEYGKFKKYCVE